MTTDRDITEHAREFARLSNSYAGPEVQLWVGNLCDTIDALRAEVARQSERCAHLAGELQALRNHVAHWNRAGIDGPALKRAEAALHEWETRNV